MKFILTIDTEGDNQWNHGTRLTVENIKYVPRFQNLCEKYFIKPTYLVTSEVCDDGLAKSIFTEYISKNNAEVGAHLHSWTTPPFLDKDDFRFNDKNHAFATEIPDGLLSEKISHLTHQIEASFGKRPLSFRSGRFGFNENVAKILAENSYLIDSSVTPFVSWINNIGISKGRGGPDFIGSSPYPYIYSFNSGSLIEIPVTILPTRFPLNKFHSIAEYYFSNVDKNLPLKIIRKLFYRNQPLWLRPHPLMSVSMLEELLAEAKRLKLPYIVMMFHSSELMPGGSIYRKDKESVEKLYLTLEGFFGLLSINKIESLTLAEAAKTFSI
jgi:hypothetical protein